MTEFSPREEYETVSEAEDDIGNRLSQLPKSERWVSSSISRAVMPAWTEALTGFSVDCQVTREEAVALEQIKATYEAVAADLEKRAAVIGSGGMNAFDPGEVLFIVLFRELQYAAEDRANMNPHKLRALLDNRFSIR